MGDVAYPDAMTAVLYRIARWCATHGWLVVIAWFAVLMIVGGLSRVVAGNPPTTPSLSGTDSAVAANLIYRAFPGSAAEATPILLHSDTLDFANPPDAQVPEDVGSALSALPYVSVVTTPSELPSLVSADGHTAMVSVTVADASAGKISVGEEMLATATEVAGPDIQVAMGGYLGSKLSNPETHMSEILGLIAAVLVLYITMRRVGATVIPLINALMAVGVGLAGVEIIGNFVFIPDVAPTLGTMLGLGVGIDYALFLVTRHRMLLRQGYDVPDAAGRTAGTAGAAMIFAGATLIAAVCGLALTGLSFLAWLGYAAAMVVACAVAASVTLVPALLGLMKQGVVPKRQREPESPEQLDASRWGRLADGVTKRPWPVATIATVVLLTLAAPATSLTLGQADAGLLPPETTARQAYDLMSEAFGPGTTAPLAVTVQLYAPATGPVTTGDDEQSATPAATTLDPGAGDPRRADPRLAQVAAAVATTPGVASVAAPVVSTDGGVAIIRTIPEYSGSDPRTRELVAQLRTEVLPPATVGQSMSAYVGGITAATSDLMALIAQKTPWFILGVVSLAFVLLMVAYRSLLIPLKAAVMNLVSIAAAYGVVVAVFQWGWGATPLGIDAPVVIESYVPMMLFAVLFGLSMDYEVFLLTAFREHWERTGDMTTAVRRGLADTGKVVTAAALIMCVVFGSFILSDNPIVKMFGVGLATAVFVDATIVRCLLVPAIMVLAQKGTWWLPEWLSRLLPQLHVEGDPASLDNLARDAERRAAVTAANDPQADARAHDRRVASAVRGYWAVAAVAVVWALVLAYGTGLGFDVADGAGALLPAAGLAAVVGGVVSLASLRKRDGSRLGEGPRAFAIIGGAVGYLIVAQFIATSGNPARGSGWLVGWATVVVGIVLVMISRTPYVLPASLAALTMLVAMLGAQDVADSAQLLLAVIAPAILVLLIVYAGLLLTHRRPQPQEPAVAPHRGERSSSVDDQLSDTVIMEPLPVTVGAPTAPTETSTIRLSAEHAPRQHSAVAIAPEPLPPPVPTPIQVERSQPHAAEDSEVAAGPPVQVEAAVVPKSHTTPADPSPLAKFFNRGRRS